MRRKRAVALLSSLAALFAACADNRDERLKTLADLGRAGNPADASRVLAFVDDPDGGVRALALVTLAELAPERAAAPAVRGLTDESGAVRAAAVDIVAAARAPGTVGLLEARLASDPDPAVRARAAVRLGRFDEDRAREALAHALHDAEAGVRLASVTSLARTGVDTAIDRLEAILLTDDAWEVRAEAARALGTATQPRAWSILAAAEDDPNEFVRAAAALALEDLRRAGLPRPAPGDPAPRPAVAKPEPPGV